MGGLKDNIFREEQVHGCRGNLPVSDAIPEPLPAFLLTGDQVRRVPLTQGDKVMLISPKRGRRWKEEEEDKEGGKILSERLTRSTQASQRWVHWLPQTCLPHHPVVLKQSVSLILD